MLIGVREKAWPQQTRVQFEESGFVTRHTCDAALYWYPAGGEGKVKKGKIVVAETGTIRLRVCLSIVQGSSSSAGVTKTISMAAAAKTTNAHLIDPCTRASSTDQMQSLPQPLYRSLSLRKFCSHGIELFTHTQCSVSLLAT